MGGSGLSSPVRHEGKLPPLWIPARPEALPCERHLHLDFDFIGVAASPPPPPGTLQGLDGAVGHFAGGLPGMALAPAGLQLCGARLCLPRSRLGPRGLARQQRLGCPVCRGNTAAQAKTPSIVRHQENPRSPHTDGCGQSAEERGSRSLTRRGAPACSTVKSGRPGAA